MVKENTHLIFKRKEKGMYFNSAYELKENDVDMYVKIFNNINYKFLSRHQQSIHHINFYKYDSGQLDSIVIKFRKTGIKPEDINVEFLKLKEESGEITDYQKILLMLAEKNNNKLSTEEKITKRIAIKRKIEYWVKKYNDLKNEEEEQLDNEHKAL